MSFHNNFDATNDMDGNPKVPDDFLDSSVHLDESNYQEGFKDGYHDGLVSGKEEGREVGLKLGFQVGEELGFYSGCVDIWNSVIQVDPEAFSSRTKRNIQQLEDLLRNYPLLDPENEHVQKMKEEIRLKFKMISTNMGVKLEYEGLLKPNMLKSVLACCKLYISESQNAHALELIEKAAKVYPEAVLVNQFKDEAYNRVGYTVVSHFDNSSTLDASPLKKVVFSMVKAAFEAIDLELHSGTHPRLGVVDHICFHPLGQASLGQAASLAKSVAADIGQKLQVPTYLYGAAHEVGRPLDSVRRGLGYFKPNTAGTQWAGGLGSELSHLKPDEGPLLSPPSKGVAVVGATRWVDNYNVPVRTSNINAVRLIARKVSERGGGLKSVQAMALMHGENCTEVACNLLSPNTVGAHQVQLEVQRLAAEEGLIVGEGYFTDFSQEKIVELYNNSVALD